MPTDLMPYQDHSLSRRERQEVAAVQDAQLPAKRAAARVNAAAFVAHSGLVNAEILTNIEAEMAKRSGAAMDIRATAIVDSYCGLVCTELTRLSLGE